MLPSANASSLVLNTDSCNKIHHSVENTDTRLLKTETRDSVVETPKPKVLPHLTKIISILLNSSDNAVEVEEPKEKKENSEVDWDEFNRPPPPLNKQISVLVTSLEDFERPLPLQSYSPRLTEIKDRITRSKERMKQRNIWRNLVTEGISAWRNLDKKSTSRQEAFTPKRPNTKSYSEEEIEQFINYILTQQEVKEFSHAPTKHHQNSIELLPTMNEAKEYYHTKNKKIPIELGDDYSDSRPENFVPPDNSKSLIYQGWLKYLNNKRKLHTPKQPTFTTIRAPSRLKKTKDESTIPLPTDAAFKPSFPSAKPRRPNLFFAHPIPSLHSRCNNLITSCKSTVEISRIELKEYIKENRELIRDVKDGREGIPGGMTKSELESVEMDRMLKKIIRKIN